MTTFNLNEKQEKRLKEWQNAIKKVFGEYGHYEYKFCPTGIGNRIIVWSDIAKISIDLTDVNSW